MSPPVLHLRSSAGLYGAEFMLLGLCTEQARRGARPTLAAFAPVQQPPPMLIALARQRQLPALVVPCRGRVDLGCVRTLRRCLVAAQRQGTRVLHCHDYKSVVYGALAGAGLPLGRVATVHGWIPGESRLGWYQRLERSVLRHFDQVCAVSPTLAAELEAAGVPSKRLRYIPNGVDVQRFQLGKAPPPEPELDDPDDVLIGTAARLSPEKNLGMLIEAVAEAITRGARLRLCVLGDGPERVRLERLAAPLLAQGRIDMPGAASALEHWYPRLDAFVLPSLSEGMPMTVLEALACGCPVLASNVGAVPDVLAGLPGCRVLPAGDRPALVDALCELRRRQKSLPALRRRVVERYSLEAMADGYDRAYEQALAA
jgi:glycosyltransferase involved in cell wall biosynthesis